MSFEQTLKFILHWEGGYVDNTRLGDSGGVTAFGISSSAYPNENMATMTKERAAQIYRRDYYDAICGDALPHHIAFILTDYAVNSGVRRAVTTLQKGVGVTVDAAIGPKTLAAVAKKDAHELAEFILHSRASFLLSLDQREFERGWIRRVVSLALEAGAMEEYENAE